MILTHIEKSAEKVIVPIEEWNEIISKLSEIEKVEIEEKKTVKSWKRKINKVRIKGNSLSSTIIEDRNENIY